MQMSPFVLLWWLLIWAIFAVGCSFTGCIQRERDALLNFKFHLSDPSNRLADWTANGDCCNWTGVICHNITSHVLQLHLHILSIEEYLGHDVQNIYEVEEYEEHYEKSALGGNVSSSLAELKHLRYLDLSNNDFGGVSIPTFLASMESLRYLNLFQAGFGGTIPPQLGNLSNLHYLNLQGSYFYNVENLDWISGLSSLEFLDLSYANLSKSFDWVKFMNLLPSLVELHLSGCQLPSFNPLLNLNFSSLSILDLSSNYFGGPIPNVLQNMTSLLRELDLSDNYFNSSIPNWFYGLSHLQYLNLEFNNLQGQVSSAIGNLTSLVSLYLSYNYELEFGQGIPKSFKNLCNLRSLYLSKVNINQEINNFLEVLSLGCVSDGLESLELSDCQLTGHLSNSLSQLRSLRHLHLSNNSISSPIPLSLGEMTSLKSLWLDSNKLNGSLPVSLGRLTKLEELYISDNSLEGEVSEIHFANLTKLRRFYAFEMGKNITLRVSPKWIPPLQLEVLGLGSWRLGPQFPLWLRSLQHLRSLDLSNSGISSPIPIWFWDNLSSIYYLLNFSHNQMHGSIPNIPSFNTFYLTIDLSSNRFSGPVPFFSPNLTALDLFNNSFSGSISNFLCYNKHEVKNMGFLNLGRNLLSGEIPDCWMSWKYLVAIKLSSNKFSGAIPNSIGTISFLESLSLHDNNLSGFIPLSLANCTNLITLDVSDNKLSGNIPTWIGDRFSSLMIFKLRANKFDGRIPNELCHVASLHILDLAENTFSGTIPSCFYNFTAMATNNDLMGSYQFIASFIESTLVVTKGKVMEYNTILVFVRSIDLSYNNLSGEIPEEIIRLAGLHSLNLSHNALVGRIPKNIGVMQSLETLDFSQNQIFGEIPPSISSLTFLNHLNLSHNKLWGKIPTSTQLQSFDSSSFFGNDLCGPPLTNNCSAGDPSDPNIEKGKGKNYGNETQVVDWFYFYVSIAPGFVVGFWGVIGPLVFNRQWRHLYFNFLGHMWNKFWVWFHVYIVRIFKGDST